MALARAEAVPPEAVRYLNRLSDAFFVWSRWASHVTGAPETLWEPNQSASGSALIMIMDKETYQCRKHGAAPGRWPYRPGSPVRVCCRILPNFAPVGSISLFAGARLRGWQAYLLPLALMAVTDPLMGGYSFATPLVYFSFLVNVWLGTRSAQFGEPVGIGAAPLPAASSSSC